jgi:hypothetical protein
MGKRWGRRDRGGMTAPAPSRRKTFHRHPLHSRMRVIGVASTIRSWFGLKKPPFAVSKEALDKIIFD